jgi:uncharacterized membrane protein required for colicin V production
VLSWRRGLSEELARVLGSIVAFWLGLRYHAAAAGWLTEHTRMEGASARVAAYIAVVLLVILCSLILTVVVGKLIKLAMPETFDKVAGGVAGLIKGTLYAVMVFLAMNMWPHEYLNRQFGEDSLIGSTVMKWAPAVREKLEEKGVTDRLREQVEASREKVEAAIENDGTKREAGRIRKWFTPKE